MWIKKLTLHSGPFYWDLTGDWNDFFFFSTLKCPKPRSASLKWKRKLLPQPPRQSRSSLLLCQPRLSPSPMSPLALLLPPPPPPPPPLHLLQGEIRVLIWRITSLIWGPSLVLITGFSTPPEESLVWYSTDELNMLLLLLLLLPTRVHSLLLCFLSRSPNPHPDARLTFTSKRRPKPFNLYSSRLSVYFLHFLSRFDSQLLSEFSTIILVNVEIQSPTDHFECVTVQSVFTVLSKCKCSPL